MKDKFSLISILAWEMVPIGVLLVALFVIFHIVGQFLIIFLFFCWLIGVVLTIFCFLLSRKNSALLRDAVIGLIVNFLAVVFVYHLYYSHFIHRATRY